MVGPGNQDRIQKPAFRPGWHAAPVQEKDHFAKRHPLHKRGEFVAMHPNMFFVVIHNRGSPRFHHFTY